MVPDAWRRIVLSFSFLLILLSRFEGSSGEGTFSHLKSRIQGNVADLSKNVDELIRLASKGQPVCSEIPNAERVDCWPTHGASEDKCQARGCCWTPPAHHARRKRAPSTSQLSVPYCYYPKNFRGYEMVDISFKTDHTEIDLKRTLPSGFPRDVEHAKVLLHQYNDALEIKIVDVNNKRYESPYPKLHRPKNTGDKRIYDVTVKPDGELTVSRQGTQSIVFQVQLSQMVFSDQFLQLNSRLPSHNIYGLGEYEDNFKRNTNWRRLTLFNKDRVPAKDFQVYGTQPFYLVMEDGGNATGVALINSNPMDIILQPAPSITFRPIGGIFHFLIFPGESKPNTGFGTSTSPLAVVSSLSRWVGLPAMPPYWSLGFQLSRYGHTTLEDCRKVLKRNQDAGIFLDVQWHDIEYMRDYNDFTYDKVNYRGLPEFVNELHRDGLHYVPILDPGVSNTEKPGTYPPFDEGVKQDIFIKNHKGEILVGKVWNVNTTVFPDYLHPKIDKYWGTLVRDFYKEISFDGLWIDMNEPSSFWDGSKDGCPQESTLDHPPYVVEGGYERMWDKTVCMSAQHNLSTHYNFHNIYGIAQADATYRVLRSLGKRPFILSRSTFLGYGYYGGHWTGDVFSTWYAMRMSIPGILSFNMFGIPYVGADICGFVDDSAEELCARWSSLGAFYPFSRNHNTKDKREQDPVAMGIQVVNSTRNALSVRYYILPYLYSLFARAHLYGEPVARPLLFEFPMEKETYDNDRQFLLGPAFMVMPVLNEGQRSVKAYFPSGRWYDFHSKQLLSLHSQEIELDAPLTKINLAVRGGYVLPCQVANRTTTASRRNPFHLLVALDEHGRAKGELFWDDGESPDIFDSSNGSFNLIKFDAAENQVVIRAEYVGYRSASMPLEQVVVMGIDSSRVIKAEVDGVPARYTFKDKKLEIYVMGTDLKTSETVIEWMV